MKTQKCRKTTRRRGESGQAVVFLVLALGIFLLGAMAFAVDMGNLWWHRQTAQTAADAACTAGVMDLLSNGDQTAATNSANSYAAKNGYTTGALSAGVPGVAVHVTFPTSVVGPKSCTTTPGTPPPATCVATGVANPYIQVNIQDRVQLYFAGMLGGGKTTDVGAQAACGLVYSNAPVPILVLKPTGNGTLSGNGNIDIKIVGGPQRSIQVNSNSSSAVSISGNSNSISLALGGPAGTGSDFAITGSESQSNAGNLSLGSSGRYIAPTSVINDPYALLASPATVTTLPARPSDLTATQCPAIPCQIFPATAPNNHGCQQAAPQGCWLFTPGLYTASPDLFKRVALFDPGLYYMNADLSADQHTCLRPGIGPGGDNGGTTFYFHGNHTLSVTANSGTELVCGTPTTVPVSQIKCTAASQLPANVNGGVGGNVLLGPCTGPYGDPLGTNDPIGEQRGILFFQDRSAAGVTGSYGGGGAFGLVGGGYFHYCGPGFGDGTTAPVTSCSPSAYTDTFSLQGGSSSSSFVVGNLTTDKLDLGGNPSVTMDLNSTAAYYVLRATLLQ